MFESYHQHPLCMQSVACLGACGLNGHNQRVMFYDRRAHVWEKEKIAALPTAGLPMKA